MRKLLFLILILFICTTVSAGDLATYVNLGFSTNSQYYMFALYGINTDNYHPYAQIYYVNVKENKFITNGVKKFDADTPVELGQNGFGVFLNLLSANLKITLSLKIDHSLTGRLIYILINGEIPKEELSFRDFEGGKKYKVHLIQKKYSSGKDVRSSFHLNVFVTDKNGNTKSHIVGLPDFKRKGVRQYRIKQIMFSPDESSLVLVIEKEYEGESGKDIRYMVETLKLF